MREYWLMEEDLRYFLWQHCEHPDHIEEVTRLYVNLVLGRQVEDSRRDIHFDNLLNIVVLRQSSPIHTCRE